MNSSAEASISKTNGTTIAGPEIAQLEKPEDTILEGGQNLSKGAVIAISNNGLLVIVVILVLIAITILRRRGTKKTNSASYTLIPLHHELSRASRPRCMTTGTSLPELPDNPVIQRVELPGNTEHAWEMDLGDNARERSRIISA